LPAAYAYRAANTLDAMIGYRGRYEWVGKPAARLDDLLNLVPARLTALLIALGSERPARALAIARRDHGRTASPNAGWPMSAMAGGLGVQLEKIDHYRLGDRLRPLEAGDLECAARTVRRSLLLAGAATVLALWARR
jgi:adenosylcobinamide-phosphate synthase